MTLTQTICPSEDEMIKCENDRVEMEGNILTLTAELGYIIEMFRKELPSEALTLALKLSEEEVIHNAN